MRLQTRLIHTHDIEANWNKCVNFIPNKGELIVYDSDEEHNYQRFKIGDGVTTIINLPFTVDSPMNETVNKVLSDVNTILDDRINEVINETNIAINNAINEALNTKDGVSYIDGGRITDN